MPEDPLLAKVAPEECLAYFASAGMAHPQASSSNQTEQLFAEPEVQHLVAQVERLIRAQLADTKGLDATGKALAEEGPTLVKALLTRPLALYVGQVKVVPGSPRQVHAGTVLSLGEHSEKLTAALERCEAALLRDKGKKVTIDGTAFRQLYLGTNGPQFTWGVKGKYLYVAVGEGELEALLKRAEGSAPKWLAALHQQLPIERVSTVGMINVQTAIGLLARFDFGADEPEVTRVLEATGLNGIERLAGVSGLDREGYVSRSLVSFKGDPKGLLQLVDQQPLTAADLAVIPRDATFAVAKSVDLEKAFATVLGVVEKIDPKAAEAFRKNLEQAEGQVGLKLNDDVLRPLGNTWCLFDSPGEGGMFTGLTAVVSLKDAKAAADTQAKLLRLVEAARGQQPDPRRGPRIEKVAFAHHTIYVLDVRERDFPLAPAWCVTDKHLIVALFPEAIKAFLSRGKAFQPLTQVPRGECGAGRRRADVGHPLRRHAAPVRPDVSAADGVLRDGRHATAAGGHRRSRRPVALGPVDPPSPAAERDDGPANPGRHRDRVAADLARQPVDEHGPDRRGVAWLAVKPRFIAACCVNAPARRRTWRRPITSTARP